MREWLWRLFYVIGLWLGYDMIMRHLSDSYFKVAVGVVEIIFAIWGLIDSFRQASSAAHE